MNFIIIVLSALFLSGCAPYFGKQSQYEEGNWYLFASSSEVARMERNKYQLKQKAIYDQLAVEKLKAQPADVQLSPDGTPLGYKGIAANRSSRPVTIKLHPLQGGIGTTFFLGPKEESEQAVLPGLYSVCFYRSREKVDCKPEPMGIGPRTVVYKHSGRERIVHWFAVQPD